MKWEPSQYPVLQSIVNYKEPYDKLWRTALDFYNKHEQWMNGDFTSINGEAVEEDITTMWRTMFKLTKTFAEVPAPRRVADSMKTKIDKFKTNLPLLNAICNPGLRDRHWDQVRFLELLFVSNLCHNFSFEGIR